MSFYCSWKVESWKSVPFPPQKFTWKRKAEKIIPIFLTSLKANSWERCSLAFFTQSHYLEIYKTSLLTSITQLDKEHGATRASGSHYWRRWPMLFKLSECRTEQQQRQTQNTKLYLRENYLGGVKSKYRWLLEAPVTSEGTKVTILWIADNE